MSHAPLGTQHAVAKAPSTFRPPHPLVESPHWDKLAPEQLTPEQIHVMDLLEGRVTVSSAAEVYAHSDGANLQRDVVLALTGGLCLTAGLVSIFFMAALGAVLLVVGALFCVAAYEHAVSLDSAATLLAEAHLDNDIDTDEDAEAVAAGPVTLV